MSILEELLEGATPLGIAEENKRPEIVEIIKKAGAKE